MAQRSAATAAQPEENASCIRVTDAETGTPYYVSAVFRSDADGEECFDLRVMDLKHAWAAAGVTWCQNIGCLLLQLHEQYEWNPTRPTGVLLSRPQLPCSMLPCAWRRSCTVLKMVSMQQANRVQALLGGHGACYHCCRVEAAGGKHVPCRVAGSGARSAHWRAGCCAANLQRILPVDHQRDGGQSQGGATHGTIVPGAFHRMSGVYHAGLWSCHLMSLAAMQLGWMFEMWRKDKDGRDKLQTLKGHVDVPAADSTAAIIERLVSQLVVNAQTYKVPGSWLSRLLHIHAVMAAFMASRQSTPASWLVLIPQHALHAGRSNWSAASLWWPDGYGEHLVPWLQIIIACNVAACAGSISAAQGAGRGLPAGDAEGAGQHDCRCQQATPTTCNAQIKWPGPISGHALTQDLLKKVADEREKRDQQLFIKVCPPICRQCVVCRVTDSRTSGCQEHHVCCCSLQQC